MDISHKSTKYNTPQTIEVKQEGKTKQGCLNLIYLGNKLVIGGRGNEGTEYKMEGEVTRKAESDKAKEGRLR